MPVILDQRTMNRVSDIKGPHDGMVVCPFPRRLKTIIYYDLLVYQYNNVQCLIWLRTIVEKLLTCLVQCRL